VAQRPEVDPERVAVMGYSFGGYYPPRVVAFEKRYAACVAFGAMHWDMEEWVETIRRNIAADPKRSSTSFFQVPWVLGTKDLDDAVPVARRFNLNGVADDIECPVLVAHGEADRIVPLEDAEKLVEAIGSDNATLMVFTAEQGGAEHVQVDNRQVGVDAIADWLAANV
jgi:dipeptidyl aminopeptidase/acylaminoacyl peptidase